MRLYTLFSFATAAAALPSQARSANDVKIQPWIAAGPGDSRAPCPMLNTLANHGYLPRNGRNITIEMFGEAVNKALNWSPVFGTFPASSAFTTLGATTAIDLEQLNNRTSGLERPASLARADDSNKVVPARIAALLADSDDRKYVTVASLGRTRRRLENASPLPPAGQNTAQLEASLLLTAMLDGPIPVAGDNSTDYTKLRARKDRVKEWLTFERLPVKLGWRPAAREIPISDLSPITAAIKQAHGAAN